MSTPVIQPTFAAGELSPALLARVDLAKYKAGAATMRNAFVNYRGGATSRPGTRFVDFAADQTPNGPVRSRLIPFTFSTVQTYVLEFSDQVMRVVTHGGLVENGDGSIYSLSTPYRWWDLPLLKFAQSADVLTLTHPSYQPADLTRTDNAAWTLTPVNFTTTMTPPVAFSGLATKVGGGSTTYSYVVTSISATTGEESLASAAVGITSAAVMSQNGNEYTTFGWAAVSGASLYNVYRQQETPNGAPAASLTYGLLGSTAGTTWIDRDGTPNLSITPPIGANPFTGGNWPGCCCYFSQRKVFAGSNQYPETFWMTQPGRFQSMAVSTPSQDDDAITDTIASQRVNAIRHLVPMQSGTIALTSSGAWQLSGGQPGAAVTPSTVQAQPQAFNGCSDLPPIVIGYEVLFGQAQQSTVRDLSYNFYVNIYTGTDITVLSSHLFEGLSITEWAYAEEPFKVIWAVRDDGVLLSLTYLKEQEVYAWARHDTQGVFESVATVVEGQEYAVYFVVRRHLSNGWVRTIERMASRNLKANPAQGILADAAQAWCVDCALSWPYGEANATLFLFGSAGDDVQVYADSPVSWQLGQVLRCAGGVGTLVQVADAQNALVSFSTPIAGITLGAVPLPQLPGTWTLAIPTSAVGGLSHLNGQTVSILADGAVVTPQVVVNGSVTLPSPASAVVVGLGFVVQLQTLPLDVGEGPGGTIQGRRKKVSAVTVRLQDSRGVQVGHDFVTMTPIKDREPGLPMGSPPPLISGDLRQVLDGAYDDTGQVCLQVIDPLPCTILGLIPEFTAGDQ